MGTLFIILTLCAQLPDPWWLIAFGNFWAEVPVLLTTQAINEAGKTPEGRNLGYSPWNMIVIVIGGLLFMLSALSVIRQPPTP